METTKTIVTNKPMYTHDCSRCTFLGTFEDYDLYYCPQGGLTTVIARFGNKGAEYMSGLPVINKHIGGKLNPLWIAKIRAKLDGLIKS